MPYPRRLDHDSILAAARQALEAGGADALSMRALARDLGVRAPSLYAYVQGRDDLVRQLIVAALEELGRCIREAASVSEDTPASRLLRIADAYLAFAGRQPRLFALVFDDLPEDQRPSPEFAAQVAAPVVHALEDLVGPSRAPVMAQTFWSLVHGYAVLHLAGQFTLNADPPAAFREGLQTVLDAMLAATTATA